MKYQTLDYRDGSTSLEAYVALPSNTQSKNPGVLVFHAWGGRDQFACDKANSLAALGYVGIAVDIYGKGVLGKSNEENQKLLTPFMQDRNLLRRRIEAGLEMARSLPIVDPSRMGAIGFCFGGLCALDLARTGVDIRGVVSFHGLLNPPQTAISPQIRAKILALHGHDDPMATPDQVLAFEKEMTAAKADWQIHVYGNTLHAFTNPAAHDPDFGTVYKPQAEMRALQSMRNFFQEVLA
jgi:dienelactone hydrolase